MSDSNSSSESASASPSPSLLVIPAGVEIVGFGVNSILNGDIENNGILTNLTVTGTITGTGELRLVDNAASASGTFTTDDGKTVTVLNGLVVSVV